MSTQVQAHSRMLIQVEDANSRRKEHIVKMTDVLEQFEYPVIVFEKDSIIVRSSKQELTTSTSTKLHRGFLENLLVVDCEGNATKIRSAFKVRGTGVLWGWTLFLNQRIKVRYLYEGTPFKIELNEVKERIGKLATIWCKRGWMDYEWKAKFTSEIEIAPDIRTVIGTVGVLTK